MQFEETDKKLVEAAENHHPAYDEKAWEKMNKLLDKHMPEKEKKSRAAFLLIFLFLLAGGSGAYFFLTRENSLQTGSPIIKNEMPAGNQPPVTKKETPAPEKIESIKPHPSEQTQNESIQNETVSRPAVSYNKTKMKTTAGNKPNPATVVTKKEKEQSDVNDLVARQNPVTTVQAQTHQPVNPSPSIDKQNNISSTSSLDPLQKNTSASPKKSEEVSKTEEQSVAPAAKQSNKKKGKGNGLFISVSVGPDLGIVGLNNAGKIKSVTGIGIGYAINKKVSVQTGFYTARKIYTAAPNDYNPPAWWWNYYPRLEKVDADCKVYEIPLIVNYNFTSNKKSSWFGSVGISSYLMKKEDYTYYYKTASGQSATRNWVYNNENKHYFSVITLAGGYEKSINKKLSLSVNPFMKMPLEGVGFGKVKLNSAGILINANIKPFAK